jgi:hypothetical protein
VSTSCYQRAFAEFVWCTSLEEALLFPGPTPVLEQVLARFVLNLRPGSRNTGYVYLTWRVGSTQNLRSHDISPNLIARATQSILEEFLRTSERSCWWDDSLNHNIDPFAGHQGDVFTLPWETKVCIKPIVFALVLSNNPIS